MNGQLIGLLLLAAAAVGLGGCAHEAQPAGTPYAASAGWVVPADYAWPPKAISAAALQPASRGSSPVTAQSVVWGRTLPTPPTSVFAKMGDVPRPRTRNDLRAVLPGGNECLARLSSHEVRFHPLEHELGIKTPIVVDGPIAGIRYYTGGNGPLVADCRLILALALVGPELTSFGVSDIRFSGAYVFRLSNKRRVSLHAYGLAIDLHGFTRLGLHYEVQHDFHKGLGTSVDPEAPITNAIATRLHASGLFHEYLTPDDNADHHDHVHVGVSPLPDEVQ